MPTPALTELFRRARPQLERELRRSTEPVKVIQVVRRFLGQLPEDYVNAARDEGAEVELTRVRDTVEIARSALGALLTVEIDIAPAPPAAATTPHRDGLIRSLLEWLFGGRDVELSPERSALLAVSVDRCLDAVAAALDNADRALQAVEPPPKCRLGWADDGDLLDLAQDLLSARLVGNSERVLLRVEQLENDLRLYHDIAALRYVDNDAATEGLFDFLPAADPTQHGFVTRRPALVSAGRLLRRGEVRGPVESGQIRNRGRS